MRSAAELLRRALQIGDGSGHVQIRLSHLPDDVAADLVRRTYEHVFENAAPDSADGWLIYRDGIEGWWTEAADLPEGEFRRLFHLRTDVVKRLTEQGLAHRRHPRSTMLFVRREAARNS